MKLSDHGVEVRGNRLQGDVLGRNIRLDKTEPGQVRIGDGEAYQLEE